MFAGPAPASWAFNQSNDFFRVYRGQEQGENPRGRPTLTYMPELPEVEITTRRLDAALHGVAVETALAPGMNTMKTFDPPLEALEGRAIASVNRIGKMPVLHFAAADGDDGLSLLVHLMSAGRLQLFEKRASPRDRASRLLLRLDSGDELRLREFGTKQRAWAKLLAPGEVAGDDMVSTLGPEAWPAPT